MTYSRLNQPLTLLKKFKELLVSLDGHDNFLEKLAVDWEHGILLSSPDIIHTFLRQNGYFIDDDFKTLSPPGLTLVSKLLVDFKQFSNTENLGERYNCNDKLAEGAESVAFRGTHLILGNQVCLKILRPGRVASARSSLAQLGTITGCDTLVLPTDVFSIEGVDIHGAAFNTICIVSPFIDLPTFASFIENQKPLSPYFILEFIRNTAAALHTLETIGLCHGDLHERNILCGTKIDNSIDIRIIDVTGSHFTTSGFISYDSDFEAFKEHIRKILIRLPVTRLSLQKHLGAQTYELIKYILSKKQLLFADVLRVLSNNEPYKQYVERKTEFIKTHFQRRGDSELSLLRYEEMIDPRQALELFEPYRELFEDLSTFGNAILYGHRGSGKSSYLASLAYFPGTKQKFVEPRTSFGIFFACRQGEFKQFTNALISFTREIELTVKHLLILKIIRKTIGILREGAERNEFDEIGPARELSRFLTEYVQSGVTLSVTGGIATELQNLHASLLRNEIEEIDYLFKRRMGQHSHRLLTERDLISFFETVRNSFSEFSGTRFFILMDDAGTPNVPTETQRVLNELIRCTNNMFCVKVSAERFSYTKECADGKTIESSHDYVPFDISDRLRLGSPSEDKRRLIGEHFKILIQKRLASYKSADIEDYLGKEPIRTHSLVEKLSKGERNPLYCGWHVVWQLADRTPRHLLELVSEIFTSAGVSKTSTPSLIPLKKQSAAIVSYSTSKLRSLGYIPGALHHSNRPRSVGAQLLSCTTAFGKVSRHYLKRGPLKTITKRVRYPEVLALERDDSLDLSLQSEEILNYLVRYAVFDDTKLTASRDDKIRKPLFIINRIYCPALQISFRREMHWRLSSSRIDSFLNSPEYFVREILLREQSTLLNPELF